MTRDTVGKCLSCKQRFVWTGKPLLREAYCPRCREKLYQTCRVGPLDCRKPHAGPSVYSRKGGAK